MGVSRDAPALDIAYKLVENAGRGRLKLSTGKGVLRGRKQIVRIERNGVAQHDVLGRHDESLPGRALMRQVMKGGARLAEGRVSLSESRAHATRELNRLPAHVRGLEPARPAYRVDISSPLDSTRERLRRRYETRGASRGPSPENPPSS